MDLKISQAIPISFSKTLPTLEQLTFVLIMEALRRVGGNRPKAAQILGISSRTIEQMLLKYNTSNNFMEIGEHASR